MTLTEFLLARIAEDEAIAKRAEPDAEMFAPQFGDQYPVDAHIEHWPPSRVLAECEARRHTVERYRVPLGGDLERDDTTPTPYWVLQLLALPYADHPDYQQDWRP